MAKVEAGLPALEAGAQGCPELAGVGAEEVASGAKENPAGSGCVCPGCCSIWFLEGFGFCHRCWACVAEFEQTHTERSSLRVKLGGRRMSPQTTLLSYLQQKDKKCER